jgi:hypothetical protein
MFDTSVFAKVVGNIPPNYFPPGIRVVVSPGVAHLLGVIDSRFYVKIKYVE